jgi:hypothetical protein
VVGDPSANLVEPGRGLLAQHEPPDPTPTRKPALPRDSRQHRTVVDLPVHRLWREHEIDGDAQGSGEPSDLAEDRYRLIGLPPADRGDVDAEQVGQVLLGHRRLHAEAEPLELLTVGHPTPPRHVL